MNSEKKTMWNMVAAVVVEMQNHQATLDKAWGAPMSGMMLLRAFALQLVAMRVPQLEIDAVMAEAREFLKPTMQQIDTLPSSPTFSLDALMNMISPLGGGQGPFGSDLIAKMKRMNMELNDLGTERCVCGGAHCPGTLKRSPS